MGAAAKEAKAGSVKQQHTPEAPPAAADAAALAAHASDLELANALLSDRLAQLKAENARLLQDVERSKAIVTNATHDYVDILQHREAQVKQAEGRAAALQQQAERLAAELAASSAEAARLKESASSQAEQLSDAAGLLADKERLEDAVRQQHALIEARGQELRAAKAQVEAKEAALDKARAQIDELSLRCKGTTALRVLLGQPFLVATSYARLRGALPCDREFNSLTCSAGGKLVLLGGTPGKGHADGAGREVSVLSTDTLTWEQPDEAAAPPPISVSGHSATVVGRNKLLVFGGSSQDAGATSALQLLSTDTVRWTSVAASSVAQPPPRSAHAAAALRDKVYVFGGVSEADQLLGDLWALDTERMEWAHVVSYGLPPCPRKGASLCCSEDGRRLLLFGGHDGGRLLNDVYVLELEQQRYVWTVLHPSGTLPEPRESHVAAFIGRYLLITGGCGAAAGSDGAAAAAAAAGGCRRLTDTHLLDTASPSGPAWEQLDDGAWGGNVLWLKQMSVSSTVQGSKLYTLQPNLHEQLDQMQIMTLTLPDEIARMTAATHSSQEQVEHLEMLDAPLNANATSLEVGWRLPSKVCAEHVTGYKLMIASSTGVVREAYQGKALSHVVSALKPAAEYVFCVKASFADRSFVWSESKAYATKLS